MRVINVTRIGKQTLMNLYRFLGFTWEFLLEFASNKLVLPSEAPPIGNDVVPVRWHLRMTSLNTTNHRSFFPSVPLGPCCKTSLSRLNTGLPFALPPLAPGGGVPKPEGPIQEAIRSSTSTREDFGTASCFNLSSPSILPRMSLVLSRSSFWIFSSSILLTIVSTSAIICSVLSYSKVLGSVWKRRLWNMCGYFNSRW